ncbi:MAG: cysteine--tRNA ligase [Lachnospiraceae bacterium]|nr:cysteine--tRNA ligase [Lachnospiraceae bacterium]
MEIYNTLTKQKEEFKPIEEGKVTMYVCGPTVYNFIHIGNARPMIVFDTVRRYFLYKGYDVSYVSNFTDVDDKIIKAAIEGNTTSTEVSERFIKECLKDMNGMNIMKATKNPKATEEIDGMIDMIQTLIDKGYAYVVSDGTVYYRTKKFEGYGKLSHKNIEDLEGGHRDIKVTGADQKEDELDFVLWKPKKEGEPFWKSPWCDGRPGWHIECSVMSKKYLGTTIDIHAGGEDLVFPHHENEIAQSEACSGHTFANYWMHNAFLNINNKKMSKSLGNFFTVREISEKFDLAVLRFFMLSAHYRNPLNFSAELMESAKNGLERIRNCEERMKDILSSYDEETTSTNEEKIDIQEKLFGFREEFENAMNDDFNTADALSAVFNLVSFINSNINSDLAYDIVKEANDELLELTNVLGLRVEREEEVLDSDIEKLIEDRQNARKNKDFAKADEIRDKLKNMGIELLDTREGVKWKRI